MIPTTASSVERHHRLEGVFEKNNHSIMAVQIGVEPIAMMVPTATPIFRVDEKNSH